jgi:hypothetical protein
MFLLMFPRAFPPGSPLAPTQGRMPEGMVPEGRMPEGRMPEGRAPGVASR